MPFGANLERRRSVNSPRRICAFSSLAQWERKGRDLALFGINQKVEDQTDWLRAWRPSTFAESKSDLPEPQTNQTYYH